MKILPVVAAVACLALSGASALAQVPQDQRTYDHRTADQRPTDQAGPYDDRRAGDRDRGSYDHRRGYGRHHRHQVCTIRRHHRVCYWR